MMDDLWSRYRNPDRGFVSCSQPKNWPEGLLIGNGTIGAIVMGHPQKECIIVTHEELFLPLFERMPVLEMHGILPELRTMIRGGAYREAAERVVAASREAGYPEDFIMTDPSHPAFDILVDTGAYAEVEEYLRSVNFATGEACVTFRDRRGARWLKRSFVSRADGVLVSRIESERPFDADVLLGMRPAGAEPWDPGRTSGGYIPKGAFPAQGLRTLERSANDGELLYRAAYAKGAGGYEGLARVSSSRGTLRAYGAGVRVLAADSIDIVAAVTPCSDAAVSAVPHLRALVADAAGTYEESLSRHADVHAGLFNRVRLTLGTAAGVRSATGVEEPSGVAVPVEEQIAEARAGKMSERYTELVFDASRYNILCSSGTLPPNLQGVWSGTWTPHWSGDYTLDANVQAAIAHYLSCGTPELMTSLFELMDRMMPDFRENARALYGARGIFVNSRVSTTGLQQRYNMCPMYFWTAGGAWIAHYYYDYYLYTGDEDFLRAKALPFMMEAALFYEDFLNEGPDGYYEFNPSVSPENHPGNSDSLVTLNATMDVAAVRELLRNLLRAASVVDIDDERLSTWRSMIDKLPPYQANEDGALKEWLADDLTDNYEHRHMSHLYPLYPGDEADPSETPRLHQITVKAFRGRMEHFNPREYGGFGLYHVAMAAARAGDADTAWDAVKHLALWHVYTGMGTSHNHGPTIFNMDASGGIPAALVEMLVVSRPGKLRLLPAVPKALSLGTVSGVRCRGGVVVERLEWDLSGTNSTVRQARAVLSSSRRQRVVVRVGASGQELSITAPESVEAERTADGALVLELDACASVEILAVDMLR